MPRPEESAKMVSDASIPLTNRSQSQCLERCRISNPVQSMSQNLLDRETSPYLLQHKDNPVHWMPWGSAAFERARKDDKPVLLSVGYAACHWCHVMAHESFEDD